jgi:hypothetical protein
MDNFTSDCAAEGSSGGMADTQWCSNGDSGTGAAFSLGSDALQPARASLPLHLGSPVLLGAWLASVALGVAAVLLLGDLLLGLGLRSLILAKWRPSEATGDDLGSKQQRVSHGSR